MSGSVGRSGLSQRQRVGRLEEEGPACPPSLPTFPAERNPAMTRANWPQLSPEGAQALGGLHRHVTQGTRLPSQLVHLVFLRVSQINGCAYCIDLHARDLLKEGLSVDKLLLVPVWHEAAHLFSDQERAALAWAEEVTRVSETHASDEAYAATSAAFGPQDLVDLTITLAAMNAFNRMGISFRLKP